MTTLLMRVVPATAAMLTLALIALAASPGLRHELTTSFARQDEHYVELYFADETAARTCSRTAGALRLDVVVRSHLATARPLAWTAAARTDDRTVTANGSVATTPGRPSDFAVGLTAPSPSIVTVTLTGRDEQLTLHCR